MMTPKIRKSIPKEVMPTPISVAAGELCSQPLACTGVERICHSPERKRADFVGLSTTYWAGGRC